MKFDEYNDCSGRSRVWRSLLMALMAPAILIVASGVNPTMAAAPMARTQAPGFYRMALGRFEVTVLSDGTHPFPVHKILTKVEPVADSSDETVASLDKVSPGEADALLAQADLAVPVQGSINAFLVNTGKKLILIDSGAGSLYGTCCGHLIENLRASGYKPGQVDEIYLTHLHADHVGGIADNGRRVFPNAIVRVSRADAEYWLSKANEKAAPSLLKPMFKADQASLKPYIDAGRFKPFDGASVLTPGIRAVPSPGHTPGHCFYRVESEGQTLLLWGDVVHVAAVQFPDPSVTVAYDSDPRQARAERAAIYSDAARHGYWVGAAHISFPGLGHVGSKGDQFAWIPINYAASPMTSR